MFCLEKAILTPGEFLGANVEVGVSGNLGVVGVGMGEIVKGLACKYVIVGLELVSIVIL